MVRLRDLNERLTSKLARTHAEFTSLKARHSLLLSELAAKDDELQRLRRELAGTVLSVPSQRQVGDTQGVAHLHRRSQQSDQQGRDL